MSKIVLYLLFINKYASYFDRFFLCVKFQIAFMTNFTREF
jgi:hypothetical protein